MNFDNILGEIKQNRLNHIAGDFNCIPMTGFARLEHYIPGIEQETYYILTASSGVGKSKLCRSLFIHNPLQYYENNPDSGIELTIKYFSLEESKKKIILSEIAKYLFTKYGLSISIKQLQSRGRYNTIAPDVLAKIEEAREHVERFLQKVDIIDSIRNPTGIYKYVRDYALTIGTYYDVNNNPLTPQEVEQIRKGASGEAYKKVSYYKKHNPKHYVIIVIDHISLLQPENIGGVAQTQWQAIQKMSSDYCLHMRDKFGFTPVVVQQQSSDKERIEANYKGKDISQKLEPSLDGLGDNKTTQRDANIILGLFAPDRYKIEEHYGYDITKFRDRYRSLHILKDRDGEANKVVPLFFNGAVDFFKELPASDNMNQLNNVYNHMNELNRRNNN